MKTYRKYGGARVQDKGFGTISQEQFSRKRTITQNCFNNNNSNNNMLQYKIATHYYIQYIISARDLTWFVLLSGEVIKVRFLTNTKINLILLFENNKLNLSIRIE